MCEATKLRKFVKVGDEDNLICCTRCGGLRLGDPGESAADILARDAERMGWSCSEEGPLCDECKKAA